MTFTPRLPYAQPTTGVLLAVLLGAPFAASAAANVTDVPLAGRRMRLTDTSGPAGRRNAVALGDEAGATPAPDPTVTGATVSIGRIGVGRSPCSLSRRAAGPATPPGVTSNSRAGRPPSSRPGSRRGGCSASMPAVTAPTPSAARRRAASGSSWTWAGCASAASSAARSGRTTALRSWRVRPPRRPAVQCWGRRPRPRLPPHQRPPHQRQPHQRQPRHRPARCRTRVTPPSPCVSVSTPHECSPKEPRHASTSPPSSWATRAPKRRPHAHDPQCTSGHLSACTAACATHAGPDVASGLVECPAEQQCCNG